jgi:disulfide oxidoreductase YuzD
MPFFLDFIGAQKQNEAAQKAADAQNKRNRVARRFTNKNQRQQFEYDKKSIKTQRKNIEQEYAFQDAIAQDNYLYQMTIQAFDSANQMRAFQQSQQTAAQQLDFNRFAQDYAIQDAARWEQEQSISLDFEEKSTMLNFRYNQLGADLVSSKMKQLLQQTRGQSQLNQQAAYVEALKNMGQAVVRGASGVTAEKVAQSSIAEAGLRMSALIDDVFNAERTFGLSMADINQKLGTV